MKHLLNILAALALSLPACAFATVYSFHNTTIAFKNTYPTVDVVPLPVEGYFIYDGTAITDWNFTAAWQPWFPETTDPLDCRYFGFCAQWQTATVVSPTSFVFKRDASPSSTRWFYLFLDAPLSGSPVTIDTTRSEVFLFSSGHYPVTAGSLVAIVPEPQTWVMLALAFVLASSRILRRKS